MDAEEYFIEILDRCYVGYESADKHEYTNEEIIEFAEKYYRYKLKEILEREIDE